MAEAVVGEEMEGVGGRDGSGAVGQEEDGMIEAKPESSGGSVRPSLTEGVVDGV